MEIKLMKYRSHNSINLSDHKPVSALFDVGVSEKIVGVVIIFWEKKKYPKS